MTADFWAAITNLSAPALATGVCALFVWALATGRLVLGKQYQAERARADEYDKSNRELVSTVIKNTASTEATAAIVTAFRRELAALAERTDQ